MPSRSAATVAVVTAALLLARPPPSAEAAAARRFVGAPPRPIPSSAAAAAAAFVVPPSSAWVGRRRTTKNAFALPAASAPGSVNGDDSERRAPPNEPPFQSSEAEAETGEPDLFEYFDPLLSPHAYPKGILPDAPAPGDGPSGGDGGGVELRGPPPPRSAARSSGSEARSGGGFIEVPDDCLEGVNSASGTTGSGVDEEEKEDPLDYFDPLLSPHAYPDGIDAAAAAAAVAESSGAGPADQGDGDGGDEEWSPLRMRSANSASFFGEGRTVSAEYPAASPRSSDGPAAAGSSEHVYKRPRGLADDENDGGASNQQSGGDEDQDEETPDLFDVFDPRLSPHAYTKGIPDAVTYDSDEKSVSYSAFTAPDPMLATSQQQPPQQQITTGVLLIDHGSRRGLSNARLATLAREYDARTPEGTTLVRAAHMEIAKPSILDGLRQLVEGEGCTRVVCVPYFLSVGKHSTQDVPRLIDEAKESLGIGGTNTKHGNVEVITTAPVGSNMDVMLGAVDTLVQGVLVDGGETEEVGSQNVAPEERPELGGLLGDIKRMMDEQL